MPERAYVFEYGTLAVGEQGFTATQFDALVRYNERHGGHFFQVGHQRLYFNSYVGVLQVGSLAIEILPKTGKASAADRDKWQDALLQMLHQSGLIEVESSPEADLRLRRSPLIDLYLESFVTEVERLNHAGLAKKYRLCEGNLNKVKGRILFSQHLRHNLFHQERMFTAHQTYDRDNVFNQILKRALDIIKNLAVRPSITSRATSLGLAFENVSDVRVTANTFIRLQLDRNTQRYYRALQLARLIILNYAPDLRGGDNNVVAILFDMNELFERFILVSLHRAQAKFTGKKIAVQGQLSKNFWGHKSIRPDVMIKAESEQGIEQFIVDTKWKIPASNLPSDQDLKQIYVYNLQFGSTRGLLVYPRADAAQTEIRNTYAGALSSSVSHSCEICFVDLFGPDRKIRNDIGSQMLAHIVTSVA
jgi:5-methylcytosine-specific restriction enzyme subunit McrC